MSATPPPMVDSRGGRQGALEAEDALQRLRAAEAAVDAGRIEQVGQWAGGILLQPAIRRAWTLPPPTRAGATGVLDATPPHPQALEGYTYIVDRYPELALADYARLGRGLCLYEVSVPC